MVLSNKFEWFKLLIAFVAFSFATSSVANVVGMSVDGAVSSLFAFDVFFSILGMILVFFILRSVKWEKIRKKQFLLVGFIFFIIFGLSLVRLILDPVGALSSYDEITEGLETSFYVFSLVMLVSNAFIMEHVYSRGS